MVWTREIKDSDDWVSAGRSFKVNGARDRGRCKKTWDKCAKKELIELDLHRACALARVRWRSLMCRNRPTRASVDNGR